MEPSQPLVVIVGPTASGKSELALCLAEQYNGEIICADSRTVYKGMDIGTAKPSPADEKQVKHHLVDVVKPDEDFTAFDFQALARRAISDIRTRGKTPFLVGGTGLYIDCIIFDYQFPSAVDKNLRVGLKKRTLQELHKYCVKHNITLPENSQNKRYVMRVIERSNAALKRKSDLIDNCLVVGVTTKKEELRQRIKQRSEHLFANGVVTEAKRLGEMYGWQGEAMTANIYRLCHRVVEGELTVEEAKTKSVTLDWRLAKRQLTWLKRNPFIRWQDKTSAYRDISDYIQLS